jgi:hypothetical protein
MAAMRQSDISCGVMHTLISDSASDVTWYGRFSDSRCGPQGFPPPGAGSGGGLPEPLGADALDP